MKLADHPLFLLIILRLDAASCLGLGVLMTVAAPVIAGKTHLPQSLVLGAGLALLPVGALILLIASRPALSASAVRLIVAGNTAWVAASLALLLIPALTPNAVGIGLVTLQAAAVALLTVLEWAGVRRMDELAPGV